ncbi:hypothetical protein KIPB_010235, partial [Kipferlia bialata]|eukprot:g10235.t1
MSQLLGLTFQDKRKKNPDGSYRSAKGMKREMCGCCGLNHRLIYVSSE